METNKNTKSTNKRISLAANLSGGLKGLIPNNEEKVEERQFSEKVEAESENVHKEVKNQIVTNSVISGAYSKNIKKVLLKADKFKKEKKTTIQMYIDEQIKDSLEALKNTKCFGGYSQSALLSAIVAAYIEENKAELIQILNEKSNILDF
jgi:hypothetical protein